jgi:hypothetical protein
MLHNSLLLGVARPLPPFYILAFFFGSDTLVADRVCFVALDLFTLTSEALQGILSNVHTLINVDDGYVRQVSSSSYSCGDVLDGLSGTEKEFACESSMVD